MSQAECLERISQDSAVKNDADEMRLRVSNLKMRVETIVNIIEIRIEQHRQFLR